MQSTFLNAFRGFKRGVDPEFESAWLYKIAQNVCLTRQRSSFRRRRIEAPGDLDSMQDVLPSPEADADELIGLPQALEGLPAQQRRALLLREWQGLSYKEIAEELDLSQAAVETLLFRARRSLAAGLSDDPTLTKRVVGKLRAGSDAGSLVALLQTMLSFGGAKVAATVATVAATSVVAATPSARHAVETLVTPVGPPAACVGRPRPQGAASCRRGSAHRSHGADRVGDDRRAVRGAHRRAPAACAAARRAHEAGSPSRRPCTARDTGRGRHGAARLRALLPRRPSTSHRPRRPRRPTRRRRLRRRSSPRPRVTRSIPGRQPPTRPPRRRRRRPRQRRRRAARTAASTAASRPTGRRPTRRRTSIRRGRASSRRPVAAALAPLLPASRRIRRAQRPQPAPVAAPSPPAPTPPTLPAQPDSQSAGGDPAAAPAPPPQQPEQGHRRH